MDVMRLILHIGMQKTGTTSIQKALFQNRELLARHGVVYPEVPESDWNKVSHYNCFRGYFGSVPDPVGLQGQVTIRDQFIESLKGLDARTAIISAECLSAWPAPMREEESLEDYWQRKAEIIGEIRKDLSPFDVTVVVTLREKASFLKSLFKQYLKMTKAWYISIEQELAEFLIRERHEVDYNGQMDAWRQHFDDVVAVDYDRKSGHDAFVNDFMQRIGIEIDLPIERAANVSPDWFALHVKNQKTIVGHDLRMEPADAVRRNYNLKVNAALMKRIHGFLALMGV